MSNPMNAKADDLLRVKETAGLLTLSTRQVRRIAGKDLPCLRVGPRSLRFRRRDVEQYLESRLEGVKG